MSIAKKKRTDWEWFKDLIEDRLNINTLLKTVDEIDVAVEKVAIVI